MLAVGTGNIILCLLIMGGLLFALYELGKADDMYREVKERNRIANEEHAREVVLWEETIARGEYAGPRPAPPIETIMR